MQFTVTVDTIAELEAVLGALKALRNEAPAEQVASGLADEWSSRDQGPCCTGGNVRQDGHSLICETQEPDPFEPAPSPGYVDPSVIRSQCVAEMREAVTQNADEAAALAELGIQTPVAGPTSPDPFAVTKPTTFSAGLYQRNGQGASYFVYKAKGGDHFLAKEISWDGINKPSFTYVGAASRFVSPGDRLSTSAHAAFGQVTNFCGFCGLQLDDPVSVQYGYGPICASKNGLPYVK